MMLVHARNADAVPLLLRYQQHGARVPVGMVMAAQSGDAIVDVFHDVANLHAFVAVMRYGNNADVLSSHEDEPNSLASLVLSDGYAMTGSTDAMRKLATWLLAHDRFCPSDRREIRQLIRGEVLSPTPDVDEALSEAIWNQDPNVVAVAMAQAFDP